MDIVNICNKFVMKTDRIYNLPILLLSTKATPQTSAVGSILTIVPIWCQIIYRLSIGCPKNAFSEFGPHTLKPGFAKRQMAFFATPFMFFILMSRFKIIVGVIRISAVAAIQGKQRSSGEYKEGVGGGGSACIELASQGVAAGCLQT